MWPSVAVYIGGLALVAGLVATLRPFPTLGLGTRGRAAALLAAGLLTAIAGLAWPAPPQWASGRTLLDAAMPTWQFRERHALAVAAPPDRVYRALRQVRADEIAFFRALTWLRRGGRPLPPGILNPGTDPMIDVALQGGFVLLGEAAPGELVIGTVLVRPGGTATPDSALFGRSPSDGAVLAAMNFRVTPDGPGGSLVSTETRVAAGGPGARRRFALYWRVIYPGSAFIRRMWLRAIRARATGGPPGEPAAMLGPWS